MDLSTLVYTRESNRCLVGLFSLLSMLLLVTVIAFVMFIM